MIVIADVAGEYNALVRLLAKVPQGKPLLFLGDVVDRGPDSDKVVKLIMDGNHMCLLGNHEHMFLDHVTKGGQYDSDVYYMNGGHETLISYGGKDNVPKEVVKWLRSLPVTYEDDKVFCSHAPWTGQPNTFMQIWERSLGKPMPGKLQLFGHNSHWGLKFFHDGPDAGNVWAVCLDDSRKRRLTAFDTETHAIYQESYDE